MYHPEAYGPEAKKLKKQTEGLVRRADHIITISQATKADIVTHYGVREDVITVAYPGVDARFSPAGEIYTAPRPYVLFVGSLNKAKDIPVLIDTVANTPFDLYLIGGNYWPDPAIEETIARLKIGDRVKRLGFVPDEELPRYYRGAIAFVTTSLREGFCLPAAEAMACGTPVVALDRGALAEVVGDGGFVVRTQNDLADAMNRMSDERIRMNYSKKAIAQSQKFRWEAFARAILNAYPVN